MGRGPRGDDAVIDLGPVGRLDDALVAELRQRLPPGPLHLVLVGGGTLNDLGKLIAAERGCTLSLVATCASMNGWLSSNASVVRAGNKLSVEAKSPEFVVLDDDLLRSAPMRLTAAGVADALAGAFALRDWELAACAGDPSFDAVVCDAVARSLEPLTRALDGTSFSVDSMHSALIEALLTGGLAMNAARSSAPASGGEHLVAHAIDLREFAAHERPSLHGFAVAIGCLLVAALWEIMDEVTFTAPTAITPSSRIDALCTWLPPMAHASAAIVDKKCAREATTLAAANVWERATNTPAVPSVATLRARLLRAEVPTRAASLGLDEAFLMGALASARDLRDRYTVFDLAFALGVLPVHSARVIERSGLLDHV